MRQIWRTINKRRAGQNVVSDMREQYQCHVNMVLWRHKVHMLECGPPLLQDQIEGYDPEVMFTIPRLAVLSALLLNPATVEGHSMLAPYGISALKCRVSAYIYCKGFGGFKIGLSFGSRFVAYCWEPVITAGRGVRIDMDCTFVGGCHGHVSVSLQKT